MLRWRFCGSRTDDKIDTLIKPPRLLSTGYDQTKAPAAAARRAAVEAVSSQARRLLTESPARKES
jgi:hypothetical protein